MVPDEFHDKTADWLAYYGKVRSGELRKLLTPQVLAEHEADPRGRSRPHSTELQQVLNFIHAMPITGKPFAYAAVPNGRYHLGWMQGRGRPASIDFKRVFNSEREAIHAVFRERLRHLELLGAATREHD
ncbi:MAG TPA: hypothetical protein VHB68_07475 [Steroidobacteraceae bacterium]|nr:hypothetical protein [Steroidobacteraceae bacterium]